MNLNALRRAAARDLSPVGIGSRLPLIGLVP